MFFRSVKFQAFAVRTQVLARSLTTRECLLEHQDGISILTLNRPQKKNALGKVMLNELSHHINTLLHSDTRVLIIKSSVPNVFCAGADLKERSEMTQVQVSSFVHQLRTTFTNLEQLPMPTISCIDGFALGGGLELALATDIRIASNNAKVGLPETNLAIIPGAGGTQRLPRLIGQAKAKKLVFTGTILDGLKAQEFGIVECVEDPFKTALEMAEVMKQKGPVALRMAKLAIDRGIQMDLDNGMSFEKQCYAQVIPTEDRLEGLKAFQEKRKPVYKGR